MKVTIPFAFRAGTVNLPAGDYTAYATAKGYSQTDPHALRVTAGGALAQDFVNLAKESR